MKVLWSNVLIGDCPSVTVHIDSFVPVPKELHHQEWESGKLSNDWCGFVHAILLCEPGCGQVACLGRCPWTHCFLAAKKTDSIMALYDSEMATWPPGGFLISSVEANKMGGCTIPWGSDPKQSSLARSIDHSPSYWWTCTCKSRLKLPKHIYIYTICSPS